MDVEKAYAEMGRLYESIEVLQMQRQKMASRINEIRGQINKETEKCDEKKPKGKPKTS